MHQLHLQNKPDTDAGLSGEVGDIPQRISAACTRAALSHDDECMQKSGVQNMCLAVESISMLSEKPPKVPLQAQLVHFKRLT